MTTPAELGTDEVTTSGVVRILTVCTHNRTRSVMMAALLGDRLGRTLGRETVRMRSAGFGPEGLPAIPDAVEAMRRRGLDVADHRSSAVTAEHVGWADLVLTAERDHVVRCAALEPTGFRRTMTLPELLAAAPRSRVGATTVAAWAAELSEGRTAAEYLRGDVPEVADPTGSAPRLFEAAVVALEQQCDAAAALIAAVAAG